MPNPVVIFLTLRRNSLHRLTFTLRLDSWRNRSSIARTIHGWNRLKTLDVAEGPQGRIDRAGFLRRPRLKAVKKLLGERPQEEQAEIKQDGSYSCIVLAVLEIERQRESAGGL